MKIIYFNTLFEPIIVGGAEKSLKNLVDSLIKFNNVEAVIVTINPENKDEISYINGIKVYRLAYRNTRFIFDDDNSRLKKIRWHLNEFDNRRFYSVIRDIIVSENPDIIHTNNLLGFSSLPIEVAKEYNKPVIHTIRDYYFQCWKSSKFNKNGICEKQCFTCKCLSSKRRKNSQLIDTVVGNSKFILDDHLNNDIFSNAKVKSVVFNIYEPPMGIQPKKITNNKQIKIGYIGRLHKSKGINTLIELFKKSEKFSLYIAGSGPEQYFVEEAQKEFNNIHYLGFIKPSTLFQKIDILVVPSLWHEPLPRTVYEAYAYGIPVIGSNKGGTPEIITDGKTGYTFNTDNFNEVTEYINKLTFDVELYHSISKNCLKMSKSFTSKCISSQYFDLYKRTLNVSE